MIPAAPRTSRSPRENLFRGSEWEYTSPKTDGCSSVTKNLARHLASALPIAKCNHPVHDHRVDPRRILERLLERGAIGDGRGIEYRDIRRGTDA